METLKVIFILFFFVLLFIAPVRVLGPIGKAQIKKAFTSKTPHPVGAAFFLLFGVLSIVLAVDQFTQGSYSAGLSFIGLVVLSFIIWLSRDREPEDATSDSALENKTTTE
jgi:hypothetical protein